MRGKFMLSAAIVAFCVTASMPAARASEDPEPKSASLAKQLVTAMAARQIEAMAAVDPAEPTRIIAALSFPGVQLLVMSSEHKSFDYLKLQIEKRQFREVYDALQFGPPASRLFFHDIGCDGFVTGEYVDLYYEGASKRTMFDGNYMAQSMTELEYAEKRKTAEEKYVHSLNVLLEAIKKVPIAT
jgi:hypothetical protein